MQGEANAKCKDKDEEIANGGMDAKAMHKGGDTDATCQGPRRRASPTPWPQAPGKKPISPPNIKKTLGMNRNVDCVNVHWHACTSYIIVFSGKHVSVAFECGFATASMPFMIPCVLHVVVACRMAMGTFLVHPPRVRCGLVYTGTRMSMLPCHDWISPCVWHLDLC